MMRCVLFIHYDYYHYYYFIVTLHYNKVQVLQLDMKNKTKQK